MKQAIEADEIYQMDDAPVSAVLSVQRDNKYGSVPGLDDDELADPDEIEKMVYQQEWGPVLALPVKGNRSGIRPVVDESGGIDWGAFGTVDFDRYRGGFDKARYKADKLREQLKDLLIMVSIVKERLPEKARYLVVKYMRMGIIGLQDIVNSDMLALARLCLRVERLRGDIGQLGRASEVRRGRRLERLFGQ